MCHENPNVENALAEMESAAEHLSIVQQRVNTPLFDLLFKLANMPQNTSLSGVKLKVLHTYTHRFMEFYMTECPDGVSIHTINANDVHEISSKLRAMGDGLARLLSYLGLVNENEQLMECVDTLAVAYDTFAVVMERVEEARDTFDPDECECDCGACNCGMCGACDDEDDEDDEDETSWVEQYHEDDDAEEFDACADHPGACANGACADKNVNKTRDDEMKPDFEAASKLFEAIFGFNPEALNEKPATKEESKPAKKPTVKVRMVQTDKNTSAEVAAKRIAKLMGLNEDDVEFEYIQPKADVYKRNAMQMQEEMNAAAKRFAQMMNNPMFKEVMPGFWRFG